MDALLLKTDGSTRKVTPKNGTDFTLEELYELLGCDMVEVVYPFWYRQKNENILICDEEGKLNNKPINEKATNIMCEGAPTIYDVIVGDALYCHTNMLQ